MTDRGDHRCTQPGPLCDPCTHRLTTRLAQLPELWVALTLNIAHTTTPGGAHVGGTPEPPCPLRPAVVDHMTLTRRTLAQWARRIADQRQLTTPTAAPPFAFHTTHGTWAAGRPWAAQYAGDIHGLWAPAMTLTGSWPEKPAHAPGVACPTCNRQALYRETGSDVFHCEPRAGGCGTWLSLKQTATTARTGQAAQAS